jgi:hypothetical protein
VINSRSACFARVIAMKYSHTQPFHNTSLSSEQKRQVDEVIVRFSQKLISITEMYNCIERIKGGHDDTIYSHFPNTSGSAGSPTHSALE